MAVLINRAERLAFIQARDQVNKAQWDRSHRAASFFGRKKLMIDVTAEEVDPHGQSSRPPGSKGRECERVAAQLK
jgi:hypothetical protein